MDKISCIILNYNDSSTTIDLVNEIKDYDCLDSVIVVDNASTDDSWQCLSALDKEKKVYVTRAVANGGYGAGNQLGIDYAVDRLGASYVIVANPDIHVTAQCIGRVKEALDRTSHAAMASARVMSPQGDELFSYWTLLPLWKDLLDTGLVTRRLFKRILNTPPYELKNGGDNDCRLVDAVPGSFFMLKPDVLSAQEVKELFDKNIFLYYEEKVLGRKLEKLGLATVLVTDQSYVHAHSVSIDKSVKSIADKQKLLHQSKLYYYKRYLHAGLLGLTAARVVLGLVWLEVWFLTAVLKMKW